MSLLVLLESHPKSVKRRLADRQQQSLRRHDCAGTANRESQPACPVVRAGLHPSTLHLYLPNLGGALSCHSPSHSNRPTPTNPANATMFPKLTIGPFQT